MKKKTAKSKRSNTGITKDSAVRIKQAGFLMRILLNPIRQKIIHLLLQEGKLTVNELGKKLRMGQTHMSHHLALMRQGELVTYKREGKQVYYSVNKARLKKLLGTIQLMAQA